MKLGIALNNQTHFLNQKSFPFAKKTSLTRCNTNFKHLIIEELFPHAHDISLRILFFFKYHIAQNFGGKYFCGFGTFASNCQKFTLCIFPLINNNDNSVTAQLPKYHHPNVFSSFIRQKLAPPKFCAIRYIQLHAASSKYLSILTNAIISVNQFTSHIRVHISLLLYTAAIFKNTCDLLKSTWTYMYQHSIKFPLTSAKNCCCCGNSITLVRYLIYQTCQKSFECCANFTRNKNT